VSGTLVLDCEGLSKVVLRDRVMMTRLAQARIDGLRVVASAATLVEARDPRMNQARFDWAASRLVIEPVTEDIARAAARLLAVHRLGGHRHAIGAMVAATALAAPPPGILITSDPEDLATLCGHGVRIVRACAH
jgi:predicted nucleic acid-binding protein